MYGPMLNPDRYSSLADTKYNTLLVVLETGYMYG